MNPIILKNLGDWEKLPKISLGYDVVILFEGFWDKWEVLKDITVPIIVWSWTREGVLNMWLYEILW